VFLCVLKANSFQIPDLQTFPAFEFLDFAIPNICSPDIPTNQDPWTDYALISDSTDTLIFMTPLNAPPLARTDGQHVTNNSVNDDNSQDESWPAFQDDFFNNPQKQDLIPFSTQPTQHHHWERIHRPLQHIRPLTGVLPSHYPNLPTPLNTIRIQRCNHLLEVNTSKAYHLTNTIRIR